MILQLGGQRQMSGVVLGGDDETGGVPVNAVDDAGPLFTVDAAQTVAAVPQQGVHQCAVRVAGGGVDDQSHRLVDHDDVLVLVHHVQRDVLGHDVHRLRVGDVHGEQHPLVRAGVLLEGLAACGDPALVQQLLGGGAGQTLHAAGEQLIGPLTGGVSPDRQNGHGFSFPRTSRRRR